MADFPPERNAFASRKTGITNELAMDVMRTHIAENCTLWQRLADSEAATYAYAYVRRIPLLGKEVLANDAAGLPELSWIVRRPRSHAVPSGGIDAQCGLWKLAFQNLLGLDREHARVPRVEKSIVKPRIAAGPARTARRAGLADRGARRPHCVSASNALAPTLCGQVHSFQESAAHWRVVSATAWTRRCCRLRLNRSILKVCLLVASHKLRLDIVPYQGQLEQNATIQALLLPLANLVEGLRYAAFGTNLFALRLFVVQLGALVLALLATAQGRLIHSLEKRRLAVLEPTAWADGLAARASSVM
mmetsp:Transcript_18916/g.60467  ORF Transcript_18916/g.60467 Transcript_18916/m.60467 type:complete len:304 (-) Transcript_18916:1311-2222(-)